MPLVIEQPVRSRTAIRTSDAHPGLMLDRHAFEPKKCQSKRSLPFESICITTDNLNVLDSSIGGLVMIDFKSLKDIGSCSEDNGW